MKMINAQNLEFSKLNELIRSEDNSDEILLNGCLGQRFIAAGLSDKKITIQGMPGNALGAYLDGAVIEVLGNAQDAVGDTMNAGSIIIHGNIGDTAGYAMRGGEIFIKGDAGYRAGIHMKAYNDKFPVMIIGGTVGSFIGEYQAGGVIIVLDLYSNGSSEIVGKFPCTGMHGGKLYLRSECKNIDFPSQVNAKIAQDEDINEIKPYLVKYCSKFNLNIDKILEEKFTVITPDSKNPYKQMYVAN